MVLFRLIRATTAPRIDEYAHATHDDSLCRFLICNVWWLTSMVKKARSAPFANSQAHRG